jgi:hypothetical protein
MILAVPMASSGTTDFKTLIPFRKGGKRRWDQTRSNWIGREGACPCFAAILLPGHSPFGVPWRH